MSATVIMPCEGTRQEEEEAEGGEGGLDRRGGRVVGGRAKGKKQLSLN